MTAIFLFGTSTTELKQLVFSIGDRNVPLSGGNIAVDEYSDAFATGKYCGLLPQYCGSRPQYWGQEQEYSVQRQECCGAGMQDIVCQYAKNRPG
ncbi:MAG: hypothetical protein LBK58_06055 [Prevotellaceae bacterium]|jgi:hypothetical protein|nr:hypothetical protein [Prevotellaceae bacterium]